VQHRATNRADGRRRRTEALQSHRAAGVLDDRSRRAVLTATLVAGVGVLGVAATATAGHAASPKSSAAAVAFSPAAESSSGFASGAASSGVASSGVASSGVASSGVASSGVASSGVASSGVASSDPASSDPASSDPASSDPASSGADSSGAASSGDAASSGTAGFSGTASSATAAEFGNADSVGIPPSPPTTPSAGDLSWVALNRKAKPTPAAVTPQWVNPLPEAAVTSCFGERWGRLHAGVDLAAANGTRIQAAGAGVVVAAGEAAGYGNAVLIDHGNGFLTHYGHLSAIVVHVGQHVTPGEQLGNEGSTGHSTGPHLHFEVHQTTYQNPIEPNQWLHTHGVDIPGCVPFTN
jgi:murein DD-endopeptidase MepM/ murein hydrolase activator NlpD